MTTMAAPPPVAQDAVVTALSTSPRPSRASGLSASLTFWWRAMLKIKHVPEQLTMVIYRRKE